MSRIETHSRINVKNIWIAVGIFVSFFLVFSSLFLLLYPFPSKEKVIYTDKQMPIIYENQIFQDEAIQIEGQTYLPYSLLMKIDPTLMFDEKSNSLIVTTKDKVIQYPNEKLQYFLNSQPYSIELPVLTEQNGNRYVQYEPIKQLYSIEVNFKEETNIVQINKAGDVLVPAIVHNEQKDHILRLRSNPNLTSPYVAEVASGETVYVEKEENNFLYVRKDNGYAGYLKKNAVEIQALTTVELEHEREETVYHPEVEWPIHLTWEAVYSKNPNTSELPSMPGVNVVSPTWFHITNDDGDIRSLASSTYIEWAKSRDYQVWALFSNDFDPERTHNTLKNFETRQKMIQQLLHYSQMYELEGINVDFENVNYDDRHLITQFMRELTPYMHQAGLIVSMDITFISGSENWSMFYEREKLAEIVDYLVVMAYDEHWASSPVAGSVSSFPWVESNLERLLEVIPNERLILGVPLYTRIWTEQITEGGNIEVRSKAYSMDYIQEWLSEHNLTPVYDEATGQNYAEYFDAEEQITYKVWIEDEMSLAKRAQLVHKYQLAGVGSWSRFFGSDQSWGEIEKSLNQVKPVQKQE